MRSVLWRGPEGSLERCTLLENRAGVRLAGTVLAIQEGAPQEVRYAIDLDRRWQTRRAEVRITDGPSLLLDSDGRGHWAAGGGRVLELDGCRDIDLEISPSTNTLPIRRLAPAEGRSVAARAAWVRFPSLGLEPLDQTYERLSATAYRYRSGDFTADLEVDTEGLVVRYGDLWEALASS
jgi:hypothetical protein